MGLRGLFFGLRRLILGLRGLIMGLRGLSFGPERADLGPERGLGGLTNIHMDGWMYGRTFENSPLCPTGHLPFGATAQKCRNAHFLGVRACVWRRLGNNLLSDHCHSALAILHWILLCPSRYPNL